MPDQRDRRNFWEDFKNGLSGFAPLEQCPANGVTGDVAMMFAEPTPDGRWRQVPGSIRYVNGIHEQITLPGFSIRAKEGQGVTATYRLFTRPTRPMPSRARVR